MLDPVRQAGHVLGRVCSILSNHGECTDRYAQSAKPVGEAATTTPETPAPAHPEGRGATHVEIRFTVDDEARADEITGALLTERLVACGQRIGPIRSRYWWSGALERSDEWLVLLKTRSDLTDRVIDKIVVQHPYETPEIVALPLVAGLADYLGWIDRVTRSRPGISGEDEAVSGEDEAASGGHDERDRAGASGSPEGGDD
jgi:periplasmic divalent cation tolerance protein